MPVKHTGRGGEGYISSPLVVGNSGIWTFRRPTPWMGLCSHLTWDGTLQDAASEHILQEGWPVVILIHHNDLQVRGVLQGRATQVQGKGP